VAWTDRRLDEYVKDHALQETDRRDGKTIWTSSLTVLPDGIRVVWVDDFHHSRAAFTRIKQ
jgi:hypothetical protein